MYCDNCQPWEGGGPIWVLGNPQDIKDFLNECGIPRKYHSEIASNVYCNSCHSPLELGIQVALKSMEQKQFERKMEKWKITFQPKFHEFTKYLQQYPYLGARHHIGRRIIDAIENFPKHSIKSQVWYRARQLTDGIKFTSRDMLPPEPTKVHIPEGRYNHFGQSHWYLANFEWACANEVKYKTESFAWIQKIKIVQDPKILNLCMKHPDHPNPYLSILATGIIYSDTIRKEVIRDNNWKPEYFVPRFIADAAKMKGYDGIVFNKYLLDSEYLVLFNVDKLKYRFVGIPYIYGCERSH